jgi:hypothetical protein
MLVCLFHNLKVITQMKAKRGWIRWHYVYLCAYRIHFLLLQELLYSIVNFGADLHVLIVLVDYDAVNVNKTRIRAVF